MKQKTPLIVYFFRCYFSTLGLLFQTIASKQLVKLFSTPRKRVIKSREEEILATARKDSIEVGKENIRTYDWGNGEKVVMLFHGWESNAGSLGAFVEPLLEKGYKVISFDAPAHGKSQGRRANLIYFKKTAKAMIEKYGVPDIAIGHSLGANTIIMTSFEEDVIFRKTILIAPLNRLMSVFEEMKAILKLTDKLFGRFIDQFSLVSGYSLRPFYFHNYGKESKLRDVLLLHDENDRITSFSHAIEMAKNWNAIRLKKITGSGHYKILWSEEVLESVMQYVEEK